MHSIHAFLACLMVPVCAVAQYGTMGLDQAPLDSAPVSLPPYHGEFNDMSGGYAVGDTVRNFIAYDADGNSVDLYAKLAGSKPVILANGSVTCPRFRDVFKADLDAAEYAQARAFIFAHASDFEWVFIYGMEAHPTDGACPSNCPPMLTTDTVVAQAATYRERRYAVDNFRNAADLDFPFALYADHPDNSIYNTYFERPSGWLALNCDGTVARRGEWLLFSMIQPDTQADLLAWGAAHTACTIDWEPPMEPVDPGPSVLPGATALSVGEAGTSVFSVFPNPTAGELRVVLPQPAAVRAFNATGQEVGVWPLPSGTHVLSAADWPVGMYTLHAEGASWRAVERVLRLD
jgi:hypothetical protein